MKSSSFSVKYLPSLISPGLNTSAVSRGLINGGGLYPTGAHNWNNKSVSKQAIAVLIKKHFVFIGFYKISKIVRAFCLVKKLWFTVPEIS